MLTCLLASTALAQAPKASTSNRQGEVLFHRNEEQAPRAASRSAKPGRTPQKEVDAITSAERSAIEFTAWDLDLHLEPATSHLATRARLTVRNISKAPISQLTLQLSSTLHWESLSAPIPVTFTEHVLPTDADHTGQMTEALVHLSQPIPPGSSLTLTGFYSGTITASGERLTRIGAPSTEAAQADWDSISSGMVALRGFGNVLWYPVSSPAFFLGDGAKLFQAIGLSRLQEQNASFRLRLTVEYVGEAPVDAFLNGHRQPLNNVSEEPNTPVVNSHGVATAEFPASPLGFRVPSLFVTWQNLRPSDNQLLQVATIRPEAIAPYTAASNDVAPLLRDWLGPTPLKPLVLIDHAGQPFEDDAFLAVPLSATDARQITPAMVHSLAHAWFRSSLPWLNEGVPQFISLLYTESVDGRDKSLAELRQLINPLTLVEPEATAPTETNQPRPSAEVSSSSSSSSSISAEPDPNAPPTALPSTLPPPQGTPGQSLIAAHDEVYYRAKAAAVLWLLRSTVGDVPFKRALQTYREEVRHADPRTPEDPRAFQRVLEAASHKDLSTLFDDWVYNDRGLADLSIVNVTPRDLPARNGKGVSWLVAVEIHNAGAVNVDVPVTVRSGTLTSTHRVNVPAHSNVSTRIVFEGVPQEVQVNDGTIPETAEPIHIWKLSIQPSTNGSLLR
ncbi:MAG TPA: hypothetical protein VFS41_03075 [Edaphobacter sp.]|nr:hypothetical protein [Edaphobacter sp.]